MPNSVGVESSRAPYLNPWPGITVLLTMEPEHIQLLFSRRSSILRGVMASYITVEMHALGLNNRSVGTIESYVLCHSPKKKKKKNSLAGPTYQPPFFSCSVSVLHASPRRRRLIMSIYLKIRAPSKFIFVAVALIITIELRAGNVFNKKLVFHAFT